MKITKTSLILIILVLLALVLRFISAYYVAIGTDEMIYDVIPLNIISAGRLSTVEQAPIYFYLIDIGYKLTGGLSLISGRLPSIIFGSFAVIIIFLITQELFGNKNISLLSAFFAAVSGYALHFSQEMDPTAFFFSLFSFYFFIKGLKGKPTYLYLSIMFLAIAVLVKPIVLLFVPAYIIIFLWYGYKHQNGILFRKEGKFDTNKKIIKVIIVSVLLAVLVVSPVLIYNYLLYKDTGQTDYYFSVLAGIGNNKLYAGQEAEAWRSSTLWTVSKIMFLNLLRFDAVLLFLSITGIILAFRKERYFTALFLLSVLFLFSYIAGKMSGANHFLWIPLILSIFAGYGAWQLKEFFVAKFKFKYVLTIIIILSILISLITIAQIIPGRKTSIAIALGEYAHKNIPKDAIVIIDPRIYRGILAWSFNEGHYLEGTYFPELNKIIPTLPGTPENIPLYYIECGPGTNCGWKPEDFQRIYNYSEQLSTVFHAQTQKIAEIKAIDTFIVYQGTINAPNSVYEIIDKTHIFWYTPVGWKYTETAVDNYTTDTILEKFLKVLGFIILYLDVLIALLSLALAAYLLGKPSD